MSLLNSKSITLQYIKTIFYYTDRFYIELNSELAKGKILCNCFFEPSTRTSLSFETAMKKLGGEVVTFIKPTSSIKKGESDIDTMKTMEQYGDILVLRHPSNEFLYEYNKICEKPLINGGNGDGEHPTQALLDLYTIKKTFGDYPLKILFVGDIKHSRTIHSLETLLKFYKNITIDYFPYPNCEIETSNKVITSYDNINEYDVVYMTRLQKERYQSRCELIESDEKSNDKKSLISLNSYILNSDIVNKMKETAIILHPLPRNEEIDVSVDSCKQAKYFEQMKNGVYVRMAILYLIIKDINI